MDVNWAQARAVRDSLRAVAGCTSVMKRAHVFVLLGLLASTGGQGTDAVGWLGMAGEVESVDEDGVSGSPRATTVMTTINALGVYSAANEQQM